MERRFKRNETIKFKLRSDKEILQDLAGSINTARSPLADHKPSLKKDKKKLKQKKAKKIERINQNAILDKTVDHLKDLQPEK
jgi:hypothetical protein